MNTSNSIRIFFRAGLLAAAVTLTLASAAIAQPQFRVLILHSDPGSLTEVPDVRAKLTGTGRFAVVDVFDCTTIPPTLAYLQSYNAVFAFTKNTPEGSVGALLIQYVNSGGGVVTAPNADLAPGPGVIGPGGAFVGFTNNSAYECLVPAALINKTATTLGTVNMPNHPIMNGVRSGSAGFSTGSIGYLAPSKTVAGGAYPVATYSNGYYMITAREGVPGVSTARIADLNFFPASSDALSGYWISTGDGAKIMANALYWVGSHQYDFSADAPVNLPDQAIQSTPTPFIPTAHITNQGYGVPTSLTVRFQIAHYGTNVQVYSYDTVISGSTIPASYGGSTIIQFPTFTPTDYDLYVETVTVLNMQPVADQNSSNDKSTAIFAISPPNNIRPMAFVNPLANVYASAGLASPIIINFKNIGVNAQTNVPVTAVIKDQTGAVVYRDTQVIASWPSDQVQVVTFKNYILSGGSYTFCGISLLATDAQRSDDTLCELVRVRFDYDAAAIGIVNPQPNEEKPFMLAWQPIAVFQSHGSQDLFNVPVRVLIRRCSDGGLVFLADSTIQALNTDENRYLFSFPSKQGVYDISTIPPGCYNLCAITLLPNDADRSNDTVCTSFSVIDRLKGDIFVGVGQRFPSIHAAVDSLRFRGVGANVRLLLTDNSYSENGTDSLASSAFGALDFHGIRGLADTATVTWIPNTGAQPRITFTGNKPFCLYFGDLFGGHMMFEGYNPAGAMVPDKLVSEPNKRSLTLINNGASAGSIFAIEEGASNITLKDLVLTNNAKFSSDSDAVVRIYNEQSRNTYLGVGTPNPIRDTVPIHNIRIENCELGNAKYGIWDHALHTQFNLGKQVFVDWRNYNNVFTRNTIGTAASPLSYTGIQFNNEQNLVVSHNEISNVNGTLGGWANVYGIDQPSVLQSDTGDVVGAWIDANRMHNLTASGSTYGIAFQQAATIYVVGSGPSAIRSTLPTVTSNRTTNNMIFDLRGASANYPLVYTTSAPTYSTDKDSIFNNSISTKNATINIFVAQSKHAFLWNNIIQNTGTGPYTTYSLQLPRPFTSAVSSDYNLFDLRGSNTFATVNEYDLVSGTLIQSRTFRRLNDWRTFTQQDMHSLVGDPLFASDSLHEPGALSYIESPASNNGAWLGTATQLHDFDGDLRLQGNQTPDIGADEFEGFQYTYDLATLSITQPAGYSATSDTTSVTIENPLWVTAAVKNLSSQAVFNVPVSALVEVAISGGPWTTIFSGTTSQLNFEVNETKSVTFKGPVITQAQAQTGVFRITVTVPNDQNNANDTAQKIFRVLLKNNATLVSYTSASPFGLRNRDSVTAALRRLSVAYDTLDRNVFGSTDLDYTPWWTMIWSADSVTTIRDSFYTPPPVPYYNYLVRVNNYVPTNFTATWTDITTTGIPIAITNGNDDGYSTLALPFDIIYDSSIVTAGTTIKIGSNGAIALARGSALAILPPPNNVLANSADSGLICLFSANMYVGGTSEYYQVDGTAPNQVLTIEYPSIHAYPATGTPVTAMQVKFYQTTGQIEFIYHDHNLDMGLQFVGSAGIGLNGFNKPPFVSNSYSSSAFATPTTDIRWQTPTLFLQPPTIVTHIQGPGALNFKETQDIERYLQAGQTYAKKSLIMAGQNIAFSNAFVQINNSVTDTEFMKSYLHTIYRANSPTGGPYNGTIQGQQTDYWSFMDHLISASPDVVAPSFRTSTVGSEITGFAYAYLTHPATPSDSGAGTTYTNPKINTVFYGFDWSDPTQTTPSESGGMTSGTTRILKGALDFITSHNGTILPVEFTDVTARRINGNGLISWTTAHQSDVARFEVERSDGSGPGAEGGTLHAIADVSADTYAFTDAGIDPAKTYTYRIAAIDLSGAKTYSPEAEIGPDASAGFALDQNYPNPTKGLTSIRFTLPVNAVVTLRILDVTGKVVSTEIVNEAMQAGEQTYTLDASKYASGSYIYELTAVPPNGQSVTLTKKMTLW